MKSSGLHVSGSIKKLRGLHHCVFQPVSGGVLRCFVLFHGVSPCLLPPKSRAIAGWSDCTCSAESGASGIRHKEHSETPRSWVLQGSEKNCYLRQPLVAIKKTLQNLFLPQKLTKYPPKNPMKTIENLPFFGGGRVGGRTTRRPL